MPEKDPSSIDKICFIAPSTNLPARSKPYLDRLVRLLGKALGVTDIHLSPYLFTSDRLIRHITASAEERTKEFKMVIREYDLIASVAGGTGAEDLVLKIDRADFRVIKERRPVFIGFSDFTFLLNEIYFRCRVPGIIFPSLRLTRGNSKKILSLLAGGEAVYRGAHWLNAPPARKISGIPIGGNLTTFVNFLNRREPPRLNWKRHILFVEDLGIDLEDLHRLLAALRRHKVFKEIRALVIGSLSAGRNPQKVKDFQTKALIFTNAYLWEVLKTRQKHGRPLPILVVPSFGHKIFRNLPAVPLGGHVSITRSKKMIFRLSRKPKT
ncbi:MAG: LD-carboxypeptidase [Candidatus Aminicenantes bacterium]|nr:LD-carboxypeptidase [Candidatus Aminicenantes bacterium]